MINILFFYLCNYFSPIVFLMVLMLFQIKLILISLMIFKKGISMLKDVDQAV